jgi:hypothetical protein
VRRVHVNVPEADVFGARGPKGRNVNVPASAPAIGGFEREGEGEGGKWRWTREAETWVDTDTDADAEGSEGGDLWEIEAE